MAETALSRHPLPYIRLPAVRYNGRVLEQFKADLVQRRLAEGSSGGGGASAATFSEQRQHAAQPVPKRARVDSSSDLTSARSCCRASGFHRDA